MSMTTAAKTYLRPLVTGISIVATDGTETLWEASDVFTGYCDSDLRDWDLNIPGKPTPEMLADVPELSEDGTFAQIYGSLGVDLNKLLFSQGQIKAFARDYRDDKKLRLDKTVAFLLFTRGDEPVNEDKSNLFVALVHVRDGLLRVYVYEFSHGSVWRAEYERRFVLPQLKA
jgi:hypothetical protein